MNWTRIGVAVITVFGAIVVSFITSKATTQSTFDEKVKTMKPIHLESGQFAVDQQTAHQYHLDEFTGKTLVQINFSPRIYRRHVDFDKEFSFIPVVRVGLTSLDSGNDAHLRIMIYSENVSEKGFDLIVQTWSDTRIYGVEANWIAYQQ
jgi:H-type lectin domain